jgi:exonuclease III
LKQADDEFRVVSWNVDHNGTAVDGSEHRWHLAMDVLAGLQPHVLLRQELTRANMHGGRMIWAEAARLGGHCAFLASATPESANPTGVYVDRDLMKPTGYFEHGTMMWHPICNPVVRLEGTRTKLSIASFHLCPFDPAQRGTEAKRLVMLRKPGEEMILGGDRNSFPHRVADELEPLPDWTKVEDRSYFEHRTIERNGVRVSDTVPDEILAGSQDGCPPVFVDLAHHAATVLGQPEALNPTASLWREDQGTMQRIDGIYATPAIAEALTGLEVIVTADVVEVSDHAPVVATFSLAKLRRVLGAAPGKGAVAA